jgi:hypothetical protein
MNNKKPFKTINFRTRLLYVLLIFWVIISIFDVGYNFIKLFSESMHWIPLSEFQKRHEVYGNIYDFTIFVGKHTDSKSSILIYSKDDKAFFLGRYFLYPRSIKVVSDKVKINQAIREVNFNYVVLDNYIENFDGFTPIASGSSWIIYKRK